MKFNIRLTALLAVGVLLSGCQQEKSERGTAGGEILPGSASDAMLPLDTVRSQPPLAPQATASGKALPRTTTEEAEVTADPTEEPAAAPSPGATATAAPATDAAQ